MHTLNFVSTLHQLSKGSKNQLRHWDSNSVSGSRKRVVALTHRNFQRKRVLVTDVRLPACRRGEQQGESLLQHYVAKGPGEDEEIEVAVGIKPQQHRQRAREIQRGQMCVRVNCASSSTCALIRSMHLAIMSPQLQDLELQMATQHKLYVLLLSLSILH